MIGDTGFVNEFVLTHSPEEIRARNEKGLASVCSDEFGIRQFSRRGGFNDTLRTQLTDSLVKLKLESGCNELLELATATKGEVEARYIVDALALVQRHAENPKGGKMLVLGAALAYIAPDGKLLLPLPMDYLSWTSDIDEFFNRREFVHPDKTLLIGGDASPLALQNLAQRGWLVSLRAPYANSPNYSTGVDHVVR